MEFFENVLEKNYFYILGRKEVVDMLIEDGANTTLVDVNNLTAFELARTNGYDDVADLFLNDEIDYSSELENDAQSVEQHSSRGFPIV